MVDCADIFAAFQPCVLATLPIALRLRTLFGVAAPTVVLNCPRGPAADACHRHDPV